MSEQDNGGPAFPMSAHPDHGYGPGESVKEGMTLRDWFAGQALAGILAHDASIDSAMPTESIRDTLTRTVECWAIRSYRIADAMLKAREQ